jgi:hypothetical protein
VEYTGTRRPIVLAVGFDDLEVRLPDRDRALEALDLSVQDQLLPALEDLREVRATEPRGRRVAGRIAQHHRERDPRATRRRRADAGDRPRRRRGLARLELAERDEPRAVLVAQRNEEHRVADRVQSLLGELGCALRPDALDELQGRREAVVRGRGLRGRGHCVRSFGCRPPRPVEFSRSGHGPAV